MLVFNCFACCMQKVLGKNILMLPCNSCNTFPIDFKRVKQDLKMLKLDEDCSDSGRLFHIAGHAYEDQKQAVPQHFNTL